METAYKYRLLWVNISGASQVATKVTISGPPAQECIHLHANVQNKKQTLLHYGFGSLKHCSCICVLKASRNSNWTGQDGLNAECLQIIRFSLLKTTSADHMAEKMADGFIQRILSSQRTEVAPRRFFTRPIKPMTCVRRDAETGVFTLFTLKSFDKTHYLI